jgi:hypothetical protein
MPGYNDVRIRPNGGFATDRAGGAYYDRSWQAAIGSTPNWIVVTSFNEWPEGTYIEPSAAYGGQYLGATAAWSAQFKAGGGQAAAALQPIVAAAVAEPPAPPPTPTPLPAPTVPTVYVQTPLLNLRGGPGTDGYEIIGQVTADQALLIVGRDAGGAWWQIQHEGTVAWLAADYVYAAGPLDGVPVIAAPVVAAANVAHELSPSTVTPLLTATAVLTPAPVDAGTIGQIPTASPTVTESYQPILQPTPTPATDLPTYQPKLSRRP